MGANAGSREPGKEGIGFPGLMLAVQNPVSIHPRRVDFKNAGRRVSNRVLSMVTSREIIL